ncbi:baseplate J/gp47 family protein [Gottfriedia sp. S16(2024)]|uniref:baseplate J/gp47 family protein n=1 Tax=Gottfriedia sp. S16(2024) TaxID=3162883 RepID=UPI003D1C9C8E
MGRYDSYTKDFILQRMLATAASDVDVRQGAVTYDMTSMAAIEFGNVYPELDNLLTFGFLSAGTPSDFVDLRVGEMGLTRKPAVAATGQLVFSGANGTVIPVGTRVSNSSSDPVYFVTTQAGTIASGTVTVTAVAEIGGVSGNAVVSDISIVLGTLSGVVTVTNPSQFTGGVDTETDDSLIARYFEKVTKPATSGNAFQYQQWAKSVAGIGDAKVYPLWNGNGTVKVVLIDGNKRAPNATIVTNATNYINGERPIGATVTVVGATEVPIAVSATLTLVAGASLSAVTTKFTSALTDYLKSIAFVDATVRYSKIASVLIGIPEILDYANLKVNNGTVNVVIADGNVAVPGTVTLS